MEHCIVQMQIAIECHLHKIVGACSLNGRRSVGYAGFSRLRLVLLSSSDIIGDLIMLHRLSQAMSQLSPTLSPGNWSVDSYA